MSHFNKTEKMRSLLKELGGISTEEFTKKTERILDRIEDEYSELEEEKEEFEEEVDELKREVEELEARIEELEGQIPFHGKMTIREEFMMNYLIAVSKKYTLSELEGKLGPYSSIVI